jgi:hypothetical protein
MSYECTNVSYKDKTLAKFSTLGVGMLCNYTHNKNILT